MGRSRQAQHIWRDTVIRGHVKGLPSSTRNPRRRAAATTGMGQPQSSATSRKLGRHRAELLHLHECVDGGDSSREGPRNYWGYSTPGLLARQRYSCQRSRGGGGRVTGMVKELFCNGGHRGDPRHRSTTTPERWNHRAPRWLAGLGHTDLLHLSGRPALLPGRHRNGNSPPSATRRR